MRPVTSPPIATICAICLLIRLPSVAAEIQTDLTGHHLILVENSTSAEKAVLTEVQDAVRQDPTKSPDVVTLALKTQVPSPVPRSCEIVRATIAGFDGRETRIEIARTVFAAVKSRPEEVLAIVGVAIEDTPERLHRDIVGAAVAAVPDPYACVSPVSLECPTCSPSPAAPMDRSPSGRGLQPNSIIYAPEGSGPCNGISLAEAILREALLCGTNESEMALSDSINGTLRDALDPQIGYAYDLGTIGTPEKGDFANDRRITKEPLSSGPTPPPPTPPPTPPPISP
jgi:hypothetical protein